MPARAIGNLPSARCRVIFSLVSLMFKHVLNRSRLALIKTYGCPMMFFYFMFILREHSLSGMMITNPDNRVNSYLFSKGKVMAVLCFDKNMAVPCFHSLILLNIMILLLIFYMSLVL